MLSLIWPTFIANCFHNCALLVTMRNYVWQAVLVAWAEIITQNTALRRLPVAGGAIEDNGKAITLEDW